MDFKKFAELSLSVSKAFSSDLFIEILGVQIGAPYNIIGLISELKSIDNALNDSLERITDLLSPKKARIAFVFIMKSTLALLVYFKKDKLAACPF